MNMLRRLFSMVMMPSLCICCHHFISEQQVLCDACMQRIQPIASKQLSITSTKSMTVFAVSAYQAPLASVILAKHASQYGAAQYAGQLIWLLTPIAQVPVDFIVPVPLHWMRYAYRGFNQAHVIAQTLAKSMHRPVIPLVRRVRYTQLQLSLNKEQRARNVAQALHLTAYNQTHKNKHILLVDDLMTTGATLQETAKTLLALNPASLTAVVLCRTL